MELKSFNKYVWKMINMMAKRDLLFLAFFEHARYTFWIRKFSLLSTNWLIDHKGRKQKYCCNAVPYGGGDVTASVSKDFDIKID